MIFCQTPGCRESLCLDCAGVSDVTAGHPVLGRGAGRVYGWRFCAQCETGVCGTCFRGDLAAEKWEHPCSPTLEDLFLSFDDDEEVENDDVEREEAVATDEDLNLTPGNEGWIEMPGEVLEIQVAG